MVTDAKPAAKRTAVIGANGAWNIVNFRKPVIAALHAAGWKVIAVAPADGHEAALKDLGVEFVPVRMDPGGTSVTGDASLFFEFLKIFRRLRPQAFLGFTIKPNIYGSIAAGLLGVRAINNISGLGTAFIRKGLLNLLARRLYRLALARSETVFFQNQQDLDLFVELGLVRRSQAKAIPGSGVDLDFFEPVARPKDGPFRFLFVGRLLRDKGVVEYAEAARLLRNSWPGVEFAMLGPAGGRNPTAVPTAEVERWQDEGIVSWLGATDDVRPFLAQADCVVLPSYREGLPRSLLEASAMARPMIATDVPGCSEVVDPEVNGLLCDARSASSLAAAMEAMLRLSPGERTAMGIRARRKVEASFDQARIAEAYLEALR